MNTAFDFFPNPLDSLKFFPNPPNELVSMCVRRVCIRSPRLGNARRAFEMLSVLFEMLAVRWKCSLHFGNAQRFCPMHGLYR